MAMLNLYKIAIKTLIICAAVAAERELELGTDILFKLLVWLINTAKWDGPDKLTAGERDGEIGYLTPRVARERDGEREVEFIEAIIVDKYDCVAAALVKRLGVRWAIGD